MRQFVLATGLIGVLALAAIASARTSTPTRAVSWTKCGPTFTFLVWPHGHPALPSIRFPEIRNPHVEAYLGVGDQWPDQRAGGYIVGGTPPSQIPTGTSLGPCLNYGDTVLTTGKVAHGITISKETAVICKLGVGVIDTSDRPGRTRILLLHDGKHVLATAIATPTRASLTIPSKGCRLVRPPGRQP
jgi:hypothetical protein